MLPAMHTDTEQAVHLRDYWRVVVKRKWTIITFFVIMVTTVTIATFRSTPIYRATTQLLIEKENPNVVSIKEVMAVDTADTDYYQTQYKVLQSRSLAQRVIETLGLRENHYFNPKEEAGPLSQFLSSISRFISPKPEVPPDESVGNTLLVNRFLDQLKIEPVRNSRLVNVSFESINPALAAQVANTLVRLYIEQNLEIKYLASQEATQWLNKRLAELRKNVEDAELALQRYKEEENIISVEERQNIVMQRLQELNTTVLQARTERINLEAVYNRLTGGSGSNNSLESLPEVINNPLIQSLKTAYAQEERILSELSRRYLPKHPAFIRQKEKVDSMKQKIDSEIAKIIQSIKTEYQVALDREQNLQQALDQAKKEAQELNQRIIQHGVLQREAQSNKQIYEILLTRFKETSVTSGLNTSNIRIIDPAEKPLRPTRPRKLLNILLSIIVGLTLGTGLAFFFEYLDHTVKTPDDIQRYFHQPFLGLVGHFQTNPNTELPALNYPRSGFAEAFRNIRTNILFTVSDKPLKGLLVTSSILGEGKTILSANLAVAMAQMGKQVLLVDADLRKPRLHNIFQLKNDYGLSNLLLKGKVDPMAFNDTSMPKLKLLTSGRLPPNPAEIVGSPAMETFIRQVEDQFDLVIFDSPPIMSVSDPVVLARLLDGVILVIKSGVSPYPPVQRTIQQLQAVSARILGLVLNDVRFQKDRYYYHYYRSYNYGYNQEDQRDRK